MSDTIENDDGTDCCLDSEAFSIPPRFSTIRLNMLDKESESMEDDIKDYLKMVRFLTIGPVRTPDSSRYGGAISGNIGW